MIEFLSAAFTMPTEIFSVLLVLVLLYWIICSVVEQHPERS